ncbi:MAG TPA: sugar ABC transporter ATP-binding protein [Sedimentisphaerales bacterium]|nr:sugar ABC transporter ATP-binding protein [Sedimentisphaerales bacterium]
MRATNENVERRGGAGTLWMTGISKRFGPVQALSDVTFGVQAGTVHALVGENGAGKSTLMKILAGVYRPDEGAIEIGDQLCQFDNPQQALAAGISMIYQDLDLAEHLTAAENVFLGNEPRGFLPLTVDHKAMVKATAELAERFNFDIDPNAVVSELPTGDCQIVEIIKALARNASIIVMDEPTSSLSETETERLFGVVRGLREKGISVIYISHRLEEIIGLADEVTVLRDGRVVHSESMTRLDIPQIVRHMVGRELTEFFPARHAEVGDIRVRVDDLSSGGKIKDVCFDIRAGEIVGMAGLVGAGRTEVARAIFGIDKKTSGSISLDGRELAINSPAEAIASGIAYLTEDRKRTGLCLELPCSWNVTLPNLAAIGMKNIIRPARENKIVEEIGSRIAIKWLGPQAAVSSLSGGNQQKLLIARWLLAQSRFLIFDEPTRGIDVGAKKEVYILLNDLAEKGKAVLFISSELPELFGIADRLLVMRRGRLVGNLVAGETTQEEVMHLAAVEEN